MSLVRSFISKGEQIKTTKTLVDRLRKDKELRRVCVWEWENQVPNKPTFSRAFFEFAKSELPSRLHEALVVKTHKDRLVWHISRDGTAIEARGKPTKSIRPKKRRANRAVRKKEKNESMLVIRLILSWNKLKTDRYNLPSKF